jgi:membrane-associated phospholipid phosphatase
MSSAITIVNAALYDYMKYIQNTNPGPTRASRMIYIWFFSITAAYNWTSSTANKHIRGIKDGWNWDTRHVLPVTVSNNMYYWMTYALTQLMPVFVPGYDVSPLLLLARTQVNITAEKQAERHAAVSEAGQWTKFLAAFELWYAARQDDGAIAAAVPPTASQLPNGTAVLNVGDSAIDPSTFPEPHKWTPLQIGVKTQKYLTYNWNNVRSSCLTAEDETTIKSAAEAHIVSGAERAAEIAEVVDITNNLTDTQKMVAEFWAGGPGTVSPPCIAVVMWNLFMIAYGESRTIYYDTYFFSGLEMAIHVFEAGRLIWGLKKKQLEARPIQEIRATYRGQLVKNGFGEEVLGEAWTPFQESFFVTPPFADFPSGHSGFSQVFAKVMTKWFGPKIPKTPTISNNGLGLISPVLADTTTLTFPTFIMPAGASQIQPSQAGSGVVVPATDITLSWTRWQDMADSAGISRKYGGIHATSAHTGSQALGRALHTIVNTRWGILP